MAENTFRSYDPLAYRVNRIEELDEDVRTAFLRDDKGKIKDLTTEGQTDFDVFICVNHGHHAFVLCVPVENNVNVYGSDMFSNDPYDVPDLIFCWKFELCYENMQLRTYKICKDFNTFKELKKSVKRPYHIGKFKNTSPKALQFASLRAAPHQYNVLLNDCVEFSKEFCVCLLSFCSNWRELEKGVHERIQKASATGLSIERLSRQVKPSGLLGNISLNGLCESYLGFQLGSRSMYLILAALFFMLVYPVVVTLLIIYYFK